MVIIQDKFSALRQQLKQLNVNLSQRVQATSIKEDLRQALQDKVGQLVPLRALQDEEIQSWLGHNGVVAVDGSVNTYGGNYPSFVTLFRALAKSTVGMEYNECSFLTALEESGMSAISELMEETGLSAENCAEKLKNQILAQLEIKVALQALQHRPPGLMLMDGGFLRYQHGDATLWEEFRQTARTCGCIVVGVIEEVGTFQLAKMLQLESLQSGEKIFDRELLFGNLQRGEWIKVRSGQEWKRDYYTCFGRLSDHPQATGFDFFPEDLPHVERVLNYLYTITPSASRGIPLWLDIIDNEVRITHQETQLLIQSTLDPLIVEKLLKAQRSRRDI